MRHDSRPVIAAASLVACVSTLCASVARAADPTTADCLASSEASVTLRSEHKLRDARAQLLTCAAPSCPADIRVECSRRVELVNAQIPTIVFEAKDGAGNDLTAVKVTMDGQPLAARLEGTAISLDPGEHKFVFEVAGQPPVTKTIVLREGEKERRERVVLGPAPAAEGDATATLRPTSRAQGDSGALPPAEDHTTRRILGYVIGGLGVASGVVAVLEFVTASSRDTDSKTAAASTDPNVQSTVGTLHHQATQAQTYGIIFGVAGVVGIGTGLALILTSGSSAPDPAKAASTASLWVRPTLGAQGGGLQLGGAW